MMGNYKDYIVKDVRLIILRALVQEDDYRLNEVVLMRILESFGHRKSREFVRDQMRWLADMGAVKLAEVSKIMIAEITRKGRDHAEQRQIIEGVARPSPEE